MNESSTDQKNGLDQSAHAQDLTLNQHSKTVQITIEPGTLKELAYIVELHKKHGAPNPFDTVEDLVAYVLSAVADGSRRPGAWEREMLEQMGIIANTEEHDIYRQHYGPKP